MIVSVEFRPFAISFTSNVPDESYLTIGSALVEAEGLPPGKSHSIPLIAPLLKFLNRI
jgi:hypothetical protein